MVERGPEKAGVGGSIPSLGTSLSTTWPVTFGRFKGYFFDFALLQHLAAHFHVQRRLMNLFISPVDINVLGRVSKPVDASVGDCCATLTRPMVSAPDTNNITEM